jgi:ATP-dependent DNA ligase
MRSLYGKDSKGELRVWSIYTEGADVVVKHGKLGGKITEKRYTAEGKNIGKANETSDSEQAVLEAEAKYVKQLKSGYFPTQEEALEFEEFTPMKAQDYKKHASKIKYPCIMQPKLNGQRLMIDKNGVAWSKQGEPLELPSHWVGVKEFAIEVGGLDGEVYAGLESEGGLSLQKIISAFRKPNEDTYKLKYYVYDLPTRGWQKERTSYLNRIKNKNLNLVVVESKWVDDAAQGDVCYENYVKSGYEGAVYRNEDGEYEFGKRSYNLIKRKPRSTAEATVKSVDKDRNGWGVLNCETFIGVQFRCQMKVDAGDKNYRLYENALELIEQVIEYEYEEESDDGVPTKPVGVGIRQVDKYGRPKI